MNELYGTYVDDPHNSDLHYVIPFGGSVVPSQILDFYGISESSVDPSDFDELRLKLKCMQSSEFLEVLLFREGE